MIASETQIGQLLLPPVLSNLLYFSLLESWRDYILLRKQFFFSDVTVQITNYKVLESLLRMNKRM